MSQMGAFVRPPVAELVFCLFDRPIHPELVESLVARVVDRPSYRLTTRITPTGHVLDWACGGVRLTEVLATVDQELPTAGRRLGHRFGGGRGGRCEVAPGIRYQVSSQVEILPPETFAHLHDELLADGARKGLLYHGCPHNRLGFSPLGVVIVEALRSAFSVASFHTFPDELAVVKTQSLIERL
jgi:hypothetical protein